MDARKKITKQVKDLLGKDYRNVDTILINELIDWLTISEDAKSKLADSEHHDWTIISTITTASKNIQSILTKLNLTPEKRARANKKVKEEKKTFDLQEFLNGNG